MNASSSHRFLKTLAMIATISVAAFSVGFAFDVHPLALFSIATSALILLGAARDYSRTLSYSAAGSFTATPLRTAERHALAA